MEIYQIYQAIVTFIVMRSREGMWILKNNPRPFLFAGLIALGVILLLFVFYSLGIYKMCKNQNVKRRWLCFVPFVNLLQVGKLTGDCWVFGRRMKRAGLYTMIASIVGFLVVLGYMFCEYYLFVVQGNALEEADGSFYFVLTTRGGEIVKTMYTVFDYLLSVVSVVQMVFTFILFSGLFKRYAPKNYFILTWLVVLVPLSRFIVPFVLRRRTPINYEDYLRRRREAYMRSTYGQNPYGNPYGNPYDNPYRTATNKPDEPFTEFENGQDDPFDFTPNTEDKKDEDSWFE